MQTPSRLLMLAFLLFVPTYAVGQENQTIAGPQIASSSNLSAAYSPSEWGRVERSVDQGLQWLAAQQADDGSFPSKQSGQPAVTSMAVMAFLARGHLPGHGRYGGQLNKAIDYVLDTQNRRGYFSLLRVAPPSGHLEPPQTLLYNHSIAGLMLGEVYGMTSGSRSLRIEKALADALVFSRGVQTRKKQNPAEVGGFRYAYPESPQANSDISVTGWALMFYRSARNAEFEIPKQYFDEGLDFIERCFVDEEKDREKGVFRYRPLAAQSDARPTAANTGTAMLTMLLGGRHESEKVLAGSQWFQSRPFPTSRESGYFYLLCYYSSQAFAQIGGEPWKAIYPQIAEGLMSVQSPNGAWPPGRGTEGNFGSTYSTSMAILALTPPYQILPIYQR